MSDKSGKVAKQGVIERIEQTLAQTQQDQGGLLDEVNRRLDELEVRVKLNCPGHGELENRVDNIRALQLKEAAKVQISEQDMAVLTARIAENDPVKVIEQLAELKGQVLDLEKSVGIQNLYEIVKDLQSAVAVLVAVSTCKHVPFSVDGRTPFYVMALLDERKAKVLVPGKPPEPTFALAICKKCWTIYPAVGAKQIIKGPADPPKPLKLVGTDEEGS